MKRFTFLTNGLAVAALLLAIGLASVPAQAATVLTVDSGWKNDTLSTAGAFTDDSAVTFTLASAGRFSLTDCCTPGDVWTMSGGLSTVSIFTSRVLDFPAGMGDFPGVFDADWTNPVFSTIRLDLGPGTYSFDLTGDGAGGIPASVGYRVDTASVPEPNSFLLLGIGLMAMVGGLSLKKVSSLN